MTYTDYLNACLNFARDTREWGSMDKLHHYKTDDSYSGWYESCDGYKGGLDVSWAFHKKTTDIYQQCANRYAMEIVGAVRVALDDDADADTIHEILDGFQYNNV